MGISSTRLRRALAALLVVTAVLFAFGSTLERHHPAEHRDVPVTATDHRSSVEAGGDESSGESSGRPGNAGRTAVVERSRSGSEATTKLAGINTESVGLEVAAIVLSLALALAAWLFRRRLVLVALVGFGLAFTAADARELVHQFKESRPGLAALASTLIALHFAVAGVALAILMNSRREPIAVMTP